MKLTTRFSTCSDRIQYIINNYTTNTDIELQQRSVEYDAVFRKYDHLRIGLLERMPLFKTEKISGENTTPPVNNVNGNVTPTEKYNMNLDLSSHQNESDSLLDLLGDGLPASPSVAVVPQNHFSGGLMDLLGDINVTPSVQR